MDARIIIILLVLFSGCSRYVIESKLDMSPENTHLETPWTNSPPTIKITTNGIDYWGLRFPEPAGHAAEIIKNWQYYSNKMETNKLIIQDQSNIIVKQERRVEISKRQRRRSIWKMIGIAIAIALVSGGIGLLIGAFRINISI